MINFNSLNEHQKEAVTITEGPILVVAGAGTGKTRVLTMRIAYLVSELGYDPNKILAFTFTNKAANEMKTRILNIIHDVHVPWIGTYHATCLKILKEDIETIGRAKNFTVLDDEDQISLIRDIYKQGEISQKDIKPAKMVAIIDKVKMNDINLTSINTIQQLKALEIYKFEDLKIVKYVFNEYQKKILALNLLDFNDLLLLTHQILKHHINIRNKWQDKFHYILVDEFQDTNAIQFEILKFLINPKTHNVFAVGDPDQTIYTWRGAYANIFNDYLDTFKNTKTLVLDLNYRSTKEILKVSNSLIGHNEQRIDKQLVTNNEHGEQVVFFKGDTLYDEANYVATRIKMMIEKHEFIYSDIAILYRANYLSRHIEQELIHHSIPYYIYGGIKFYQRMEIKDLLAYLHLMCNPDDETALKRIINVPRRNIGLATIDKITEYARIHGMSFSNALKLTDNNLPWLYKSVAGFLALLDKIRQEVKNKNILDTLKTVIKDIDYETYLKSLDFETRNENVQELLTSIKDYEDKNPEASISTYLQEISLYTDPIESRQNKHDAVSLMTVHVAKGSEYKVVFIIDMNDSVMPSTRVNDDGDIEEERRIAYVAMTRAMKKLYLTCADGYSFVSNKTLTPSRFIKEIGLKNLKVEEKRMMSINDKDLEWYDSKQVTDYQDNYASTNVEFNIGDAIAHTTFGSGIIVGIKNNFLDIAFKAPYGIKTLVKNHKAIKRLKH